MPLLLVALFIGIPILEITVIDQVQQWLGWPLTILILVADSILGAVLVRQEGTRAWRRFTLALAEGQAPAREVVDGALILFGGALLLTPGFVTDVVGLACVVGPTRSVLNGLLLKRFSVAAGPLGSLFMVGGRSRPTGSRPNANRPSSSQRRPPPGVIDVEVVDVQRNKPSSGDTDDDE